MDNGIAESLSPESSKMSLPLGEMTTGTGNWRCPLGAGEYQGTSEWLCLKDSKATRMLASDLQEMVSRKLGSRQGVCRLRCIGLSSENEDPGVNSTQLKASQI